MINIHPQYIVDPSGKKLVVLPQNEFETLMEAFDDQNDIRLYDEAKKEDDSTRILLADYLKNRLSKNA